MAIIPIPTPLSCSNYHVVRQFPIATAHYPPAPSVIQSNARWWGRCGRSRHFKSKQMLTLRRDGRHLQPNDHHPLISALYMTTSVEADDEHPSSANFNERYPLPTQREVLSASSRCMTQYGSNQVPFISPWSRTLSSSRSREQSKRSPFFIPQVGEINNSLGPTVAERENSDRLCPQPVPVKPVRIVIQEMPQLFSTTKAHTP